MLSEGRKMKNIIFLFVLIAFVVPVVTAVPDSVVNGLYKISFDIGLPHEAYNVKVSDPIIDETLGGDKRTEYTITITNITEFRVMNIGIKYLETALPFIATGSDLEASLKSEWSNEPSVSNFQSASRIIDGMKWGGCFNEM